MGVNPVLSKHGQEAIDCIQQHRQQQDSQFDLILMDCEMPTMDGYTATEEIRRFEDSASPHLIVGLSAHAVKERQDRAFEAGMDQYLTKPVKIDDIAKVLHSMSVKKEKLS